MKRFLLLLFSAFCFLNPAGSQNMTAIGHSQRLYQRYIAAYETANPKTTENKIYCPNLCSGVINLSFENSGDGKLCVFDVLGHCILTQPFINNSSQQLEFSGRAKGTYLIRVEVEERRYHQKIVLN